MRIEAKNISFRYNKGPWILRNVSLSVEVGERVGLIGPSGYGKSTLSKIIAGYEIPIKGEVLFDGNPLPDRGYCPVQLIYQNPEKAVNPRWKMRDTLYEAWKPDDKFLKEIGIEKEWLNRWPSELSGGELQRFCVARALGPKTKFLIADEMSTMLDVITQAQIWDLMLRIVKKNNLGMIVVTHNEELAKRVCTRIVDLRDINNI